MALSLGRKQTLTSLAAQYAEGIDRQALTYLGSRGIDATVVADYQLGSVTGDVPAEHQPYKGMISIPYVTKTGVVGFKFRHTDNHHVPKYKNPTGQATRMFNVMATFTDLPFIAVCEGELDALIADSLGIPAVGIAGVRAWKPQHPRLLDGFEFVVILADNDEKEDGSNPGHELARAIMEDLPQAQVAWLPRGQDVNEVFLTGGREAVINLLPENLRKMLEPVAGVGVE